jgi:enolase-phosphatase E1
VAAPADILLLDIEGTTTPIEFVYGTLFPYARERMSAFVRTSMNDEELRELEAERRAEADESAPAWRVPPDEYLLWLMSKDRKSRALKRIQGRIWEAGYLDGSLKGTVFDDVAPALRAWRAAGGRVYIYSSGSVLAQQLLFRYSTSGDLTSLIDGYFDTEVGGKRESGSYRTIAQRIGAPSSSILFVSDIPEECAAANGAGMRAVLSVRPGNAPCVSELPVIRNFAELAQA